MEDNEGSPELDPRAFRSCLGQFGTGVTVVATRHDARLAGSTIGSFSSLSLDPPLVLWSIARSSRSFAVFEQARRFTINVLAEDQIGISQHFSSSSSDKFADMAWFEGSNGCPVLPGIVALFECERQAAYDGGDHLIIVGKVQRFARYPGKPLLFVQSKYAVHQTHPTLQSLADVSSSSLAEPGAPVKLATLLVDASRLRVNGFEKHRRAEGVSYLQSMVLFEAFSEPHQTIAELAGRIFSTTDDCADAVADLTARGFMTQDSSEWVSLTKAGREKRDAIQARGDQYEAECLAGFTHEQIRVVRDFLNAFVFKLKHADARGREDSHSRTSGRRSVLPSPA